MDEHDTITASEARILYSLATAATDADGCPFVYVKDLDTFYFPDARFGFDRQRADRRLAEAIRRSEARRGFSL